MTPSESLAPDHPLLSVECKSGKTKTRKTYKLSALSTESDFRVHNTNLVSVVRALKERIYFVKSGNVFVETPLPKSPDIFELRCSEFKESFLKHVQYAAPYSRKQFLRTYDGRRRTAYERAFEYLDKLPFKKAFSYVNFFVKCEKINFTLKPDSAPRGISPRDKRYNCKLGPYIKRIEKKIYKLIAIVFDAPTVFKGMNAAVSGMNLRKHWDHFNDPVAVGLDASRFDQHVSQDALKFEHSFYNAFFHKCEELRQLLKMQLVNRGFARVPDGNVKFSVPGKRMSGDMNTGLGNCLLMCAMIHSFVRNYKIEKYRLANNGDDCVLFVERKDLHKLKNIKSYFKDFGFDMKCEKPVSVFEQIEFCQTHPVWTPQGWIMVRNVPTSIAKDCLSLKPLDNYNVYRSWCAAVAECGLSLTGGIPVAQEFYTALARCSTGRPALRNEATLDSGFARLAIGMDRKYQTIHPKTRASFWRAFGIEPDKQIAFENVYKKVAIDFFAQQLSWEPNRILLS